MRNKELNRLGDRDDNGWRRRLGERGLVSYLLIVGAVTLAVAIGAGYFASGRVGMHIAVDEALAAGDWIANTIAEPNVTDALLAGDQSSIEEFDRLFQQHVLSKSAVRVKLWTADGRIVYSDEPRLIGETFELGADEVAALQDDAVLSKVGDPDEPENRFEADLGRVLQVYKPVQTVGGERLLFEVYFSYDVVTTHSRHVWTALAPIIFAAVLVLGIVHVPLAMSLSRYQQRHRAQREKLLRRAVETSNLERRRVAADLHDGVIQDLTATSFGLAAVEGLMSDVDNPEVGELVSRSVDSIRASVADLRSLVVDIYPPNLRERGVEGVIADLLDSAAKAGLATSFETQGSTDLTPDLEVLAYRTVREAVHNTIKHADAHTLRVEISNGTHPLVVEITDDGKGFAPDIAPGEGHLGLQLLSDLAGDLGAELEVISTPGEGTLVRLAAGQ